MGDELWHGPCRWTVDDDGVWNTDCGHDFVIIDATPAENEMKFCCYCGYALVQVVPEPEAEEDDDG